MSYEKLVELFNACDSKTQQKFVAHLQSGHIIDFQYDGREFTLMVSYEEDIRVHIFVQAENTPFKNRYKLYEPYRDSKEERNYLVVGVEEETISSPGKHTVIRQYLTVKKVLRTIYASPAK